jgi:hypothetical protein
VASRCGWSGRSWCCTGGRGCRWKTAQQSNGALTIVALAQEAGVPRNALTQRRLDLKNYFCVQVRASGQTPDSEIPLRQQTGRLKEHRAKDATELAKLRTEVEHLVRVVNQLTTHNRQLLSSTVQHYES